MTPLKNTKLTIRRTFSDKPRPSYSWQVPNKEIVRGSCDPFTHIFACLIPFSHFRFPILCAECRRGIIVSFTITQAIQWCIFLFGARQLLYKINCCLSERNRCSRNESCRFSSKSSKNTSASCKGLPVMCKKRRIRKLVISRKANAL